MNDRLPRRTQKRRGKEAEGSKKASDSPLEGEIIDPPSGDAPPENQEEVSLFIGPLPHPHILKEYDKAHPGTAERIVRVWEEEQAIRKRDNLWTQMNDFIRVSGSIIVPIALIGAAVYFASIEQLELGVTAIVISPISGIIRAFTSRKNPPE